MKKLCVLTVKSAFALGFMLLAVTAFGQTEREKEQIIKANDHQALQKLQNRAEAIDKRNREEVLAYVQQYNVPLIREIENGGIAILDRIIDGSPIYLKTDNTGAAVTTNTTALHNGGSLGLNIDGQNMTIGIWDGGEVRSTHVVFGGRVTQVDNASGFSDHATHVSGTLVARAGFQDPEAEGMASEALLQANDFNNDFAEMIPQSAAGLLVSNHSYGFGADNLPLYFFGSYDGTASFLDEVLYATPFYTMVCSAGNDRNLGFNSGDGGYDLLTDRSVAKNNITVAAVNEVTNYVAAGSVIMSSFSSWGPTDDGRIKPDISAKGVGTFSSIATSNGSYATYNGTSMASPNVAGSLILLQQLHRNLYGDFMRASTLKAMAIHTAREAGSAAGPDYRFGWGLLNTGGAARIMLNDNFLTDFSENTLDNGATYTQTVNSIGDGTPLVVTVVWTDPAGEVAGETEDDPTPRLVNDLDVRVEDENGTVTFPWKLDVSNFSAAATKGDNIVDNVEKIEVPGASGNYIITVTHKGALVNDSQDFSIIIGGISEGEFAFTADEVSKEVCDDASETFNFNFVSSDSYNSTTTLTVSGAPAPATVNLSPSTLNSDGPFALTLSNLGDVPSGNYPITVTASGGGETRDYVVNLEVVFTGNLNAPILTSPAQGATNIAVAPTLQWDPVQGAQTYLVELSLNNDFNSIIFSDTSETNSYQAPVLSDNTQYFWRISPNNSCSSGDMATSNFTTEAFACDDIATATDNPQTIANVPATIVTSTITIPAGDNLTIADVDVTLDISHTYLADMLVSLTSPNGTTVLLMDQVCGEFDDVDVIFDDAAVDLMCATTLPTVQGVLKPSNPLSAFNGEDTAGDWTLTIDDNFNQDGGSLNNFALEFCASNNLGVAENTLKDFSVYPNPASDVFYVNFAEASAKVSINVFDINGRKLISQEHDGNGNFTASLSTANLSSGIYFVKVSNGELSGTQKLVVK